MALNNRNQFSQFRKPEVKTKVSVGPCGRGLFRGFRGESLFASSSFWWSWIPWLVAASLQAPPSSSHGLPPVYLCVLALPLMSLIRMPATRFRTHPKSRMILSLDPWLYLQRPYIFPDKITFTGTGGWDLDIFWGGCYSTHCTPVPWTHCGSGISRLVQESNTGKCLMLGRAEQEVLFSCVCWGVRKVPTPLPQPPE